MQKVNSASVEATAVPLVLRVKSAVVGQVAARVAIPAMWSATIHVLRAPRHNMLLLVRQAAVLVLDKVNSVGAALLFAVRLVLVLSRMMIGAVSSTVRSTHTV